MKTMTISIALLVAATFILGSASSAFAIKTNATKLNEMDSEILGDPAGPDPKWIYNSNNNPTSLSTEDNKGPKPLSPIADTMYGFIVYGAASGFPNGPCYWPLDDPQALIACFLYWSMDGWWYMDL
jgi:hypothetical protein